MSRLCAALVTYAVLGACSSSPEPKRISLIERFDTATIENAFVPSEAPEPVEWRFEGDAGSATGGWKAVNGITGLEVRDGRLVGRAGDHPILAAPAPDELDADDLLHAVEIRLRVSGGERLGINFGSDEKLDEKAVIDRAMESPRWSLDTELIPGDDVQTYTLTSANSTLMPSFPLSRIQHVLLTPTDEPGAEFELESVRLISLKEHLSSIESGIGWHGLGEIFRETIVSHSPERIVFDVELPSDPYLELAIGTVENGPVTFRVELSEEVLLERTVSTPRRWESIPIDLTAFAGRRGLLALSLAAKDAGAIGFWATPVIRQRTGPPAPRPSSPARTALLGNDAPPPQGVILVLIDTLRRDYFQPYGHERENAPILTALAAEGALFEDTIAQATWTKVSVPTILTSLYPSTHGLADMPDRLPAAVTTLAEVYRDAGFATFATSSVPFTGKLSNLHQGVDVLHERSSIPDVPGNYAKTARTYVDRLLPWLEEHRDVPFFAFLHVFDPHTPFEPYRPYDAMWMAPDALAEHREDMERVAEEIDNTFRKDEILPTEGELRASGVDREMFLAREKIWYDASIRAMDVEIGRLIERLRELELSDRTLVAVISDHGEEFLEHGRHFHGYTAYGEMLNVPFFLWWPGAVPAGLRVDEMVESIDLMPTLLELSRLPVPEEVQGQSLLPLLVEGTRPGELGWRSRPAFAERRAAPAAFSDDERKLTSFVIISDGWKLIRNTERPEGWPEYELYDHGKDPLNFDDVAQAEPEIVERLAEQLEAWREATLAARVEADEDAEGISAEELQRLRSLGYVQ